MNKKKEITKKSKTIKIQKGTIWYILILGTVNIEIKSVNKKIIVSKQFFLQYFIYNASPTMMLWQSSQF